MTLPSEKLHNLWTVHEPFILNRLTDIKAVRTDTGCVDYIIHLNNAPDNVLIRQIDGNIHTPNPWLQSLRLGKNPASEFLTGAKRRITTISQGETVELADIEHPMRWVGAGGLLIIRDREGKRYIPLNRRLENVVYGGFLDANGGFASRMVDWLAPKVLGLREIIEELILVYDRKILVPLQLKNCDEDSLLRLLDREELVKRQKEVAESVVAGAQNYTTDLIPIDDVTLSSAKDTLTVIFKNQVFTANGIVLVDPSTGSLDLRNIYEIAVETIENLVIIDGETQGYKDEPNSTVSKDREMILIEEEDLKRLVHERLTSIKPKFTFRGGIAVESYEFTPGFSNAGNVNGLQMTPALERMLEVIYS